MFLLEHAPALIIAVPLLTAFIIPLISRISKKLVNLLVILTLSFAEFLIFLLSYEVIGGKVHVYTLGASIPSLTSPEGFPIRIILEVDAMSALISLTALSIALIFAVYSLRFIEEYNGLDKYYSLFLILTAGIIGMCFTGDFFTLFVFLEITSISSAALIAFFRRAESFEAAFKYIVISAIGALFLLFAVGLLYSKYDLLNMAAIANEIRMHYSFLDLIALCSLVSALLLKSGSVPVHMWKPDAFQEAPIPIVGLLLLSSLTSLYVMFRICFSIFGLVINSFLGWIIVTFAVLSISLGVTMALPQKNLKRMIAYAAIAEIGYVMLGIGTGLIAMPDVSGFAFKALLGGIFHIINDALDIGLLFLVIGAIFYSTRKRNIDELGGLAHNSKSLSILFIIGLLAVSGLPPFNGFVSKLIIYESVFYFNPLLAVIGILGSILMLAIFVKVFISLFLGEPYKGTFKRIPISMTIAMYIIAFFILFLGLFPQLAINYLIMPAANALINPSFYIGGVL